LVWILRLSRNFHFLQFSGIRSDTQIYNYDRKFRFETVEKDLLKFYFRYRNFIGEYVPFGASTGDGNFGYFWRNSWFYEMGPSRFNWLRWLSNGVLNRPYNSDRRRSTIFVSTWQIQKIKYDARRKYENSEIHKFWLELSKLTECLRNVWDVSPFLKNFAKKNEKSQNFRKFQKKRAWKISKFILLKFPISFVFFRFFIFFFGHFLGQLKTSATHH